MKEDLFRARAYKTIRKTTPRPSATAGPWNEPVNGVEWAEGWLLEHGSPQESFVDLYFNGDTEIHTSVYYMEARSGDKPPLFGIANSSVARWPVEYVDDEEGHTFPGQADPFGRDLNEWRPGDSDEDEEPETDEEESPEDEENEDDEDEDENDNQDEQDEQENEEEDEMPRLMLFAKMRGPKGWRKRAETDPERDTNRFGFKIGLLAPEREKTHQQEWDRRVEVQFTETDSNRKAGKLKVILPDGVDFTKVRNTFTAEIPYYNLEEKDDA